MSSTPETPKALTDAELDEFPGVIDMLHGLCAITAPDGPISRAFYDDAVETITILCTTIATQAKALAEARNDALGWRPSYEDLYKAVYTALVELKMSDETHEWKPVNGLDVPCVVATISQALLALKTPTPTGAT